MQNVIAILRRELADFFGHPLAYIVITLFLGMFGLLSLWFNDVLTGRIATMAGPFFWVALTLLFLAPAITMRLLAEERRTGSLEMVSTLPLTSTELVTGKWLAAVVVIALALALTITWPIALSILGDLDWGPVLGGYFGLLLLGSAFAAIGVATSSLTENQVVAFLIAFAICLVPWLTGTGLDLVPPAWVPVVQYLTFEYHYANLARGVLDTRSLVFFASVVVVVISIGPE